MLKGKQRMKDDPSEMPGISNLCDQDNWKKQGTLGKKKLVYRNDNKLLYNYVVCDMAHPKAYKAREHKAQNFPLVSTSEMGYYNVI